MASLLSKVLGTNASGGINIPIPPETLRTYLRAQPAYVDNRERAAVVLDQGFKVYDTLAEYRTPIFLGAALNLVFSLYMLKKRRNQGPEAVALWSASAAASAGLAWMTRPGVTGTPPAGTPKDQIGDFGIVSMVDKKRAELKQRNPGFADDVFRRLSSLPGIKEPLDSNPLVKAAIV
jgi:hypothetical protein